MSDQAINAPRERRHFSMIRNFHLADLFTISNGFCGVWAIFEAMKYLRSGEAGHVYKAALLVPLAAGVTCSFLTSARAWSFTAWWSRTISSAKLRTAAS